MTGGHVHKTRPGTAGPVIGLLALCAFAAILGAYAAQTWVFFTSDKRSALDTIADLRAGGQPAVIGFFPGKMLSNFSEGQLVADGKPTLPLGGISGRRTVQCLEVGRQPSNFAIYDADEHGFRNPPGLWAKTPAEAVLIGDSFAHGDCVPENKDMAGVMRRTVPSTITLGMRKNGPLLELAALAEFGPILRPRTVLWLFYENDLRDLENEAKIGVLGEYLSGRPVQNLAERQASVDAMLTRINDEIVEQRSGTGYWSHANMSDRRFSTLVDFLLLRNLRQRFEIVLKGQNQEFDAVSLANNQDQFMEVLRAAKTVTAQWGGRMIFVALPGHAQFLAKMPAEAEARARLLDRVSGQVGIATVDLHPLFADHPQGPEQLFLCFRCHYTEEGYRLVGEALVKLLAEHSGG